MAALTTGGVVATLGACGDGMAPEQPDLTGTWDATSAVVTNIARPSQALDAIPLGLEFVLIVGANGSAEVRITTNGDVEIETGTMVLEGDRVTLRLAGDVTMGTYSLVGTTLTLDIRSGVTWDFEGDGTDIPATLLMVLERRA